MNKARLKELEVVLKGGKPWGFKLKASNDGIGSSKVDIIDLNGKAAHEGTLQPGDHILKVNHVSCHSTDECFDLIDSAFNTLTLTVWRGSSDVGSPEPVQTLSFKHRRSLSKSSEDGSGGDHGGVSWSRHRGNVQYRRELSHGPPVSHQTHAYPPNRRNSFSCPSSWRQDPANRQLNDGPSCHVESSSNLDRCPTSPNSPDLIDQPVYENLHSAKGPNWSSAPRIHKSSHKNLRSERKLTKDSGYETSLQSESDYVNSDWVHRNKSSPNSDMISPDGSEIADVSAELRAKSAKLGYTKSSDPLDSYKFNGNHFKYPSSDSLSNQVNCTYYDPNVANWMRVNSAKSTPSLVQNLDCDGKERYADRICSSTTCLANCNSSYSCDHDNSKANMGARRFKKASVYETLASKSGFDFAPMIQNKQYWERNGSREDLMSHVRQASNQSSGSDWASSGYHSMSFHSKQSSCSTEGDNSISFPSLYDGMKESVSELDLPMCSPPPPHDYYYSDFNEPYLDESLHAVSLPPPPIPPSQHYLKSSSGHESNGCRLSSTNSSSLTNITSRGNVKVLVQNLNKQHALNQQKLNRERRYKSHVSDRQSNYLNQSFRNQNNSAEYLAWSAYGRNSSRHPANLYQVDNTMHQKNCNPSDLHSNSSTPLLDRLKKESEMCKPKPCHESSNSFDSGAESIGSCNSSQETLKWHDSNSDLNVCVVSSKSMMDVDMLSQSTNSNQYADSINNNSRRNSSASSWYSQNGFPVEQPGSSVMNDCYQRNSHALSDKFAIHLAASTQSQQTNSAYTMKQSSSEFSHFQSRPKNLDCHVYKAQPVTINNNNQVVKYSPSKESNHWAPTSRQYTNDHAYSSKSKRLSHSSSMDGSVVRLRHQISDPTFDQRVISSCNSVQGSHAVVHSSRVLPPQRHNSHSVMYYNECKTSSHNNAYQQSSPGSRKLSDSSVHNAILLKNGPASLDSSRESNHGSYQKQPSMKTESNLPRNVQSNNSDLKALQKKAVLSFFERRNIQSSSGSNDDSKDSLSNDDSIYMNQSEIEKTKSDTTESVPSRNVSPPKKVLESSIVEPKSNHDSVHITPEPSLPSENVKQSKCEKICSVSSMEVKKNLKNEQLTSEMKLSPKKSLLESWSRCSSPDLPLPPPPKTMLSEVVNNNDPLPPPPVTAIKELKLNDSEEVKPDENENEDKSPSDREVNENLEPQSRDFATSMEFNENSSSSHEVATNTATDSEEMKDDADEIPPPLPSRNYRKLSPLPTQNSNSKIVASIRPQQREETIRPIEDSLYENKHILINKTTDCSTQTTNSLNRRTSSRSTLNTPKFIRKKRQAELECKRLSQDLINQINDESLSKILIPAAKHRTTVDYIEGLFEDCIENNEVPKKADEMLKNINTSINTDEVAAPVKAENNDQPLPADSAYFTTSESKAKFLTRYNNDLVQEKSKTSAITDEDTLKKKQELIESITRKLDILKSEQLAISDEINLNQELGQEVEKLVVERAKRHEIDKFTLHVEELGKIVKLLLSLSGRLARAENALIVLPKETNIDEKNLLIVKRDKLSSQYEEAKRLKECIDRRSLQVSKFLKNYLSEEEYNDYEHFIQMKSKLVVDSRDIDDRIKLGEEQLSALYKSIGEFEFNRS